MPGNLGPPPPKDSAAFDDWLNDLYEFLKHPTFHVVCFVPRSEPSSSEEGDTYYNSTSDKLNFYNGSAYEEITSA